jgi:hypothetical protein
MHQVGDQPRLYYDAARSTNHQGTCCHHLHSRQIRLQFRQELWHLSTRMYGVRSTLSVIESLFLFSPYYLLP